MPPPDSFEAYWLAKYGKPIWYNPLVAACSLALAEEWRLDVAALHSTYTDMAGLLAKQWRARRELLERPLRGSKVSFRARTREERRAFRAMPGPRRIDSARGFQRDLAEYAFHTHRLLQILRKYANPSRPRESQAAGPAQDFPLACAAYEVSKWIRERHPRGPRWTSWDDTATCLEWYCWDLSSIAGNRGDALRRRVQRGQKTGELPK